MGSTGNMGINNNLMVYIMSLFNQGYYDAKRGDEWIKEDMPLSYYEGVRKFKIEYYIITGE